jgi:hypothetical protein
VNDPDLTAARPATIRERVARFVESRPRARKATADRSTQLRPSDPERIRRLPDPVHLRDMRRTQEIRPTRDPRDERDTERDFIVRYACGGLGDNGDVETQARSSRSARAQDTANGTSTNSWLIVCTTCGTVRSHIGLFERIDLAGSEQMAFADDHRHRILMRLAQELQTRALGGRSGWRSVCGTLAVDSDACSRWLRCGCREVTCVVVAAAQVRVVRCRAGCRVRLGGIRRAGSARPRRAYRSPAVPQR